MSQGVASNCLVDFLQRGDYFSAVRWINAGGEHRELWTFMLHYRLGVKRGRVLNGLLLRHESRGYAVRRIIWSQKDGSRKQIIELGLIVGYREGRARDAAVAILSLKRRGLLSKDLSTLVAKTVYLSYENRYSEAWGRPADWATPIMQVAAAEGVRLQLGILDCVTQLVDIIDRFFPLIMMILMILILF